MSNEQLNEVESNLPALAEFKALKKAGKFWEIFSKVLPFIKLLVATGWFLPKKVKDALTALILAGEAYLEAQADDNALMAGLEAQKTSGATF